MISKEDLTELINLTEGYIWILETDYNYDLENGKRFINKIKDNDKN